MKVLLFSDFKNQVKRDIKNFKSLFQIKGDGGIEEECICVQLNAINKG